MINVLQIMETSLFMRLKSSKFVIKLLNHLQKKLEEVVEDFVFASHRVIS